MFFVKHFAVIPPPYGGVSVFVKRLSLALSKHGLLSSAFHSGCIVGIPQKYNEYYQPFPKHARSLFVLPYILRLLYIFKPYQILHTHASFTTCFTVLLIHKILKIPVVYTVHSQMIDREFSFLNCIDRFCLRSLASDSKVQFITVNQNSKKRLIQKGLNFFNEIKVIPAYIPPVEIGSPSDYLSSSLISFMNSNQLKLLFYAESFALDAGRDVYGTRLILDLFIRLKQNFPHLKLIFCLANLRNDIALLEELKELITTQNLNSDVYWQIGAIPEMWPLLQSSTVLVRPTITDGDSIMIREALAFGLPVITSDVVQRPRGCITYRSGSFDDLYTKTSLLLNRPFRKVFEQKSVFDDILNIYHSLLS